MAGWITDAEIAYNVTLRASAIEADSAVERSLGMATALLKEATALTGWHQLISTGEDEVFTVPGFESIRKWSASEGMLDVLCPLRSVTLVRVIDTFGDSVRSLDPSEYRLDVGRLGFNNWLRMRICVPVDPSRLEITGKVGRFAADGVPDDLNRAALRVAVHRVVRESSAGNADGVAELVNGPFRERYSQESANAFNDAEEAAWRRSLNPYRRVAV